MPISNDNRRIRNNGTMNTFELLKAGDNILYTKINNSKIVIGPEGIVFKTKVKNIIKSWDLTWASITVENRYKPIGTELDAKTYVLYEKTENPDNINVYVFGLSEEEILKKTLSLIKSNINDLIIAKDILEEEYRNVKGEFSIEEAASMAL